MSSFDKILFVHLSFTESKLKRFRQQLSTAFENGGLRAVEEIISNVEMTDVDHRLVERQIKRARQCNHQIISFLSDNYPALLLQLADFPLILYCRGNMARLKDSNKIAIIGSRKPTYDGQKMCDLAGRYLAKWPYTIVSGLAYGIDSLAHRAALRYGCPTIVVLANPIDEVRPRPHVKLANSIIEAGGLIISETPYFEDTLNHYYVRRNRIISGLCKKVFVVEGAQKSGSMTTAQHAIDQNRELYAMPGSISNNVATGTNALIRSGAHVVIEPADLFVAKEKPAEVVKEQTHPVAQLLLEQGQMPIEKMSQMMDIPIHILLSELTVLECQDILKVNGNMVTLIK